MRRSRLQQMHGAANALEQIERLESRDNDGHAVAFDQRIVLPVAHHAAHVPGGKKRLHAALRRVQMASIAGGTSTCETSIEKFRMPCSLA